MSPRNLVVYIPSWRNFNGAVSQVMRVREQSERLIARGTLGRCQIVVSENGTEYLAHELVKAGATRVLQRPCDLGADTNIALGFLEGTSRDLLWILSDNDPCSSTALATILEGFTTHPKADILIGTRDQAPMRATLLSAPPDSAGESWAAGLISGVVYNFDTIAPSVRYALEFAWTGWSQLALQRSAFRDGLLREAVLVPLDDLVDHTAGDRSRESVAVARAKYRHSFFGGVLLDYGMAGPEARTRRCEASRWWRRYWYLASAYRSPRQRYAFMDSAVDFREGLASSLVRTGSPIDRGLWLLSLLPYWRAALLYRRLRGNSK